MSKTYYLVIDDDCRPAIYPTEPQPITPTVPPVINPLPPVEPVPPIGTLQTARVTTDGANLNIRRTPSINSEVIGRVPNGATVTVLEQGTNGWYKISYNGIVGYVASRWVTLNNPNTPVEPMPFRMR